jgi:hypothetical protein
MSKILIATPCYGRVVNESYLKSLLATQNQLIRAGHQMLLSTFSNESLITRARNNLMAGFLGSEADMLMFIDSDIGWRPQALLDLIASGHDLCGIPYPTKGYDWDRANAIAQKAGANQSKMTGAVLRSRSLSYTLLKHSPQPTDLPKGWLEVNALGTGFMLIQRHVIEKMKAHYWDQLNYVNDVKGYLKSVKPEHCVGLFETMIEPETRRYLSEDYAFCRRWRDIGGRIFACGLHKLTHTGAHEF